MESRNGYSWKGPHLGPAFLLSLTRSGCSKLHPAWPEVPHLHIFWTPLSVKKFFLISNLNIPWCNKPSKQQFHLSLSFPRASLGQPLACPLMQPLPSGQPFWLLLLWLRPPVSGHPCSTPTAPPEQPHSLLTQEGNVLLEGHGTAARFIWSTPALKGYPETQATLWCQHTPQHVSMGQAADYLPMLWSPWSFCYGLRQADPSYLACAWFPLQAPLFLLLHP